MNRHHRILRKIILWLADLFVILAAYASSLSIRFGSVLEAPDSRSLMIFILILLSTIISLVFELDSNFMNRGFRVELGAVVLHNALLTLGLIVFFYIIHNTDQLSRLTVGYFVMIGTLGIYTERLFIKKIAKTLFNHDEIRKKIILISDKKNAALVNEKFPTGFSYTVVGNLIINENGMHGQIGDQTVDCKAGCIPNEIVTAAFDDIFLYAPSISREWQKQLINDFAGMGVRVHVAVGLPIELGHNATLSDFGTSFYCVNYAANVFNPTKMAVKRFVDIIGSLVGMLFTGIIWVFLAPAIKLDSRGPVFFSQTRVGKNGKRFKIYKFRSMYQDAEARKADLMKKNQMKGLMFKMDDDPRVTKVGKFIRRTSLDEFPQFLNVLKGDMSLVGTRPPTENEFLQYNSYYRARLTLRPGLTGLWQVSGRSDIDDFDEVVKLDMQYINNWSLGNDLRILCKTFGVLFKRTGAK